jgi:hypothetical protein
VIIFSNFQLLHHWLASQKGFNIKWQQKFSLKKIKKLEKQPVKKNFYPQTKNLSPNVVKKFQFFFRNLAKFLQMVFKKEEEF